MLDVRAVRRMSEAERRRRALARALARGGAGAVVRLRYGLYRVPSSSRPGRYHTVRVDGDAYRCDCESGLAGHVCWAMGAVFIAKTERASGGRVTRPAAN